MLGIEYGSVLLESAEWIRPSIEVTLKFDRITLTGTVRCWNAKHNIHRISVAVAEFDAAGEQAAPRFPMDEPGTLIVLGDNGTNVVPCRLTDFSRSGLGPK